MSLPRLKMLASKLQQQLRSHMLDKKVRAVTWLWKSVAGTGSSKTILERKIEGC
jgi:hypothetical protein